MNEYKENSPLVSVLNSVLRMKFVCSWMENYGNFDTP